MAPVLPPIYTIPPLPPLPPLPALPDLKVNRKRKHGNTMQVPLSNEKITKLRAALVKSCRRAMKSSHLVRPAVVQVTSNSESPVVGPSLAKPQILWRQVFGSKIKSPAKNLHDLILTDSDIKEIIGEALGMDLPGTILIPAIAVQIAKHLQPGTYTTKQLDDLCFQHASTLYLEHAKGAKKKDLTVFLNRILHYIINRDLRNDLLIKGNVIEKKTIFPIR